MSVFYKGYVKLKDTKASLRYAMGHSGLAIVMTVLTTVAGLWSFSFSAVAPVADLGVFASSGVLWCWLVVYFGASIGHTEYH
ncbi:hypothetical protein [Abyssogena phaseoliformis symbiont]|uniref:hypothetical protein n=1 Tax=Abyssogena phaseoliformis symbiont TaxID=596095 RepID=UPI0019160121|nr:hypothetical protein [Abyssogena phaseoliformis symbiont]